MDGNVDTDTRTQKNPAFNSQSETAEDRQPTECTLDTDIAVKACNNIKKGLDPELENPECTQGRMQQICANDTVAFLVDPDVSILSLVHELLQELGVPAVNYSRALRNGISGSVQHIMGVIVEGCDRFVRIVTKLGRLGSAVTSAGTGGLIDGLMNTVGNASQSALTASVGWFKTSWAVKAIACLGICTYIAESCASASLPVNMMPSRRFSDSFRLALDFVGGLLQAVLPGFVVSFMKYMFRDLLFQINQSFSTIHFHLAPICSAYNRGGILSAAFTAFG
jgi:hypothetical protein